MKMPLSLLAEVNIQQAIVQQPLLVSPTTSVIEALTLMSQVRASCALGDQSNPGHFVLAETLGSCVLVMADGELRGIFTERDVIQLSAEGQQLAGVAIADVMSHPVITLPQSELTDLFLPMNLMQQHRIRHLPVLNDDQQVVGLLTHESLQQLLQPINLFRLRLVSEVMIRQVVSAPFDCSVLDLTKLMATHRIGSIVIVDERPLNGPDAELSKIPLGIVTERDIVQFQALGLDFEQIQANVVMSQPVFSVCPGDSLLSARTLMQTYRVSRVVVVGDQDELEGIITQSTLLQTLSPVELYRQLEGLEERISQLEAEKLALLQQRTVALEAEVQARTAEIRLGAEREKLLGTISNRIRASLNLQNTLNAIVTEVRRWLECDRVVIYQFQSDWTGTVLAEAVTSRWEPLLGQTISDSCFSSIWVAYRNGRIRVVDDVTTAPMASCHRNLLSVLKIRAKILLPIIVNDRLWGLLLVAQNHLPRTWKSEEIELVQQISTQAAIAIQQAELYQQAQLDLQERHRAETLLRESEEQYRTTLSNISDAVFITDDRGNFTFIGPNIHILFGYTVAEAQAMGTIGRLLGEDLFDLPQLIAAGEIANIERVIHDRQGRQHTVLVNVKRVQIGDGTILYSCRDVSDRKQIEEALQNSEERLRTIIATSASGLITVTQHGTVVFANPAAAKMLGLSSEQLHGWLLGFPCACGDPRTQEIELHQPSGQRRTATMQTAKIFWKGQDACLISLSDITDLKQVEESLRQSESRYRLLMENLPVGVVVHAPDTHILTYNAKACALLGLTSNQMQGKTAIDPVWTFRREDDTIMPSEEYPVSRVLATQRPLQNYVVGVNHPDTNTQIWTLVNAFPVFDHQFNLQQVVVTFVDISDRRQAEITLRQSERRYASLTEASPVGIFRTDNRGNCLYVNDRWCQVAGLKPQDALGEGWQHGLHPDDRDLIAAEWYQAAQENRPFRLEYRFRRRDGTTTWVYGQAVAEHGENGEITGYVGTITDITPRIQVEMQLHQLNAELEQRVEQRTIELARATRHKDEFLANMSHELRTPLNAILGMSEGLQEKIFGNLTERQQHAISTIESSGRHLLELINDILDLAKIEAGKLELQIAPVSVDQLCQTSLAFIKQQATQKQIQLRTVIQPVLNEITLDERRIRQVLINLLSNAVKFTPEGGTVTLSVERRRENGVLLESPSSALTLCFAVSDTGIGIPPEELDKLFQSFVQIDSSLNRQQAGTGLGLALVKRITELHGGKVSVTSEFGQGSCFTVCLPYVDGSAHSLPEGALTQSSLQGLCTDATAPATISKILLAEDNEANICTITGYLESRGYQTIVATNGRQAVERAKAEPPDLILMDIQMPDIDGLEAICLIRSEPHLKQIPIIALTALAMPGDRDRCFKAGATDYMTKPVRLKQLVCLIQQRLQK